jgi:DNA-binding NtrC family response regulator
MMTITILPEESNSYRALSGDKESTGRTMGEALDALRSQLTEEESGTLVIVQNYKPDQFFEAEQQERLTELMRLHKANSLTEEEEGELASLVEAELHGAMERAEVIEVLPAHFINLSEAVSRFEIALIKRALKLMQGNLPEAAKLLYIKPSTLHAMLKRHHIDLEEFEPARAQRRRR